MESTEKKNHWNEGATAGLIFGLISIAYLAVNALLSKSGGNGVGIAVLISAANIILWAAKFFGCIALMKMLMKKYAACYPEEGNSGTFKYGVVTALLSALLYSGFYLAYVLFIDPDMLTQAMDTVMQSYSSMMDSNSLEAMENMKGSLPQIVFISNFIYCFLFGTILSAILSRNIPSDNPFKD